MVTGDLNGRIKMYRTSKNMTLAVLAKRLGVTTSAVASYENGSRNPSFDVLIKIARVFNVTIDNLLGSSNRDLIDVSDLTINQREHILSVIATFQKFNFTLKEMFNLSEDRLTENEGIIASDVIWNVDKDLETFKEFIKKNKNKK